MLLFVIGKIWRTHWQHKDVEVNLLLPSHFSSLGVIFEHSHLFFILKTRNVLVARKEVALNVNNVKYCLDTTIRLIFYTEWTLK